MSRLDNENNVNNSGGINPDVINVGNVDNDNSDNIAPSGSNVVNVDSVNNSGVPSVSSVQVGMSGGKGALSNSVPNVHGGNNVHLIKSGSPTLFRWQILLTMVVFIPIIFLVAIVVSTVPLMVIHGFNTEDITIAEYLIATIIAELLTVGAYLLITNNWLRDNVRERLGFQNFQWKPFLLSFVLGILMFGGLQGAAVLTDMVFGSGSVQSSDTSSSILESNGFMAIILMVFLAPIVAPIVEEILFRGVILNGMLLGNVNKIVAVILASFAFAIVHFQGWSNIADVFTLVWICFMAVVQCLIFVKTRSIYNNMALHVSYNSVTVLIPLLLA